MNKLFATILCTLAWLWTSFAGAEPTPLQPDLSTAAWSVNQASSLNAEPKDAVWRFINDLWGNGNDLNAGSGKVCEFKFADLHRSGQLSLVVSYDSGGLADCNLVNIFDKTASGIKDYDFNGSTPVSLNSVQDIHKDGNYEVIVNAVFAAGGMHQCIATWPVIYAWNGTGYADVSTEYKAYYQNTLTGLQRQINPSAPTSAPEQADILEKQDIGDNFSIESKISQTPSTPISDPGDIDCLKAEAAKIQRFLDISRDAGVSDAIKWADSDNPDDREFAAPILSDIGTTEAIGYLRPLSDDPDRNVARSGKELLKNVGNGAILYPTIQGELVSPAALTPSTK